MQTNQSFDYHGHKVAYHEAGAGDPMIMMHNGGCSHIIWKNQIEHFSQNYRVFAFDLLGFGNSGRPRFPLTLDLYVEMLRCFISENHIVRPILMGNCIGASISLEYAGQTPNTVRALILSNICGGVSMMRYFHPYMFPPKGGTFSVGLYKLLFSFSRFDYVKEKVIERLYGPPPDKQSLVFRRLVDGLRHPLQPQSRIMLIKGLDTFNKFDHYKRGEANLPPAMVFWGEKNRVLPVERGKIFIDRLQPQSYKIYSNLGHLCMAEDPKQFNGDVEDFLANY